MFGFRKGKVKEKSQIDSRELLNLLEFFVSNYSFEMYEDIYRALDKFIESYYQKEYFLVFSCPADMEISKFSTTYRALYNRDVVINHLTSDLFDDLSEQFIQAKEDNSNFVYFNVKNTNSHCLYLGTVDGQDSYAFFSLLGKKKIELNVATYLSLYVTKAMYGLSEFLDLKKQNDLIYIDDVSNLFNQRKLDIDLRNHISRYDQYKKEFTMLFLDIDHFKEVNDNHGHLVGTQILKDLGEILAGKMREYDYIYRYGGDEFVLILPNCNASMGKVIGERLLSSISNSTFLVANVEHKITVSIGVAAYPRDAKSAKELIAIADKMMYSAKKNGRNAVCLANEIF